MLKKALVQVVLQRERERVRERERGRAFADYLSRNDEWTVKDSLASAYAVGWIWIRGFGNCVMTRNRPLPS